MCSSGDSTWRLRRRSPGGGDTPTGDVLAALGALVDRSLISNVHSATGHRLTVLESVREFLLEELERRGTRGDYRRLHADYFAALVKERAPGLRGPEQEESVSKIDTNIENIRAAIAFLSEQGDDAALAMVDRLFLYWRQQGSWSDGLHWTRLALQGTDARDSALRARMLSTVGFFASDIGQGRESIPDMEEGLAMARRLGDPHAIGYTSSFLGAELSRRDTDLERGIQLLTEAQEAHEGLGEWYGAAWVNRYLGLSHQERGNLDEAIRLQSKALEAFREAGDAWNIRFSQTLLAEAMHAVGDLEAAREIYDESLRGESGPQFKVIVAQGYKGLGKVSLAEGALEEAAEDLYEAQRRLRDIGDIASVAETRSHLGMVHLGQGHLGEAEEFLTSALRTFREINDQGGVAWSLERLAALAFARESFERAAVLVSAGASIRERVGSLLWAVYKSDVERLESDIAAHLEPEVMERAIEEGAALGLDDAVAFALKDDTAHPSL